MKQHWPVAAGLGAWFIALAWYQPPLEVALLLLGPLVATPLVLGLVRNDGGVARWPGPWKAATWLQFPAAVCVAVSFATPTGPTAALWTVPWLLFAVLLAFLALARFVGHRFLPLREVAVDAALGFLLVGAFWLSLSRWDQEFLGYRGAIVFYTAAHFHFAGFVLPLLAGLAARALPSRFAEGVCGAVVAGIPMVAVGIVLEYQQSIHWANVLAVTWLTLATLGVIWLQARLALRPGPLMARLLWGLSAAALPVGMTLATLFVYGNAFGGVQLTYDQMVHTHAVVNVFGFALPGLAAWTLASKVRAPAPIGASE